MKLSHFALSGVHYNPTRLSKLEGGDLEGGDDFWRKFLNLDNEKNSKESFDVGMFKRIRRCEESQISKVGMFAERGDKAGDCG